MFIIMRFFTGLSLAGISIISIVLSEYEVMCQISYKKKEDCKSLFDNIFQMWNGSVLNVEPCVV